MLHKDIPEYNYKRLLVHKQGSARTLLEGTLIVLQQGSNSICNATTAYYLRNAKLVMKGCTQAKTQTTLISILLRPIRTCKDTTAETLLRKYKPGYK